ncbi:MAG: iron uptake porin [Aphanothece sp. CMT-3BRIN-NPC111]|jgi:BMFP domain-containing protein YqiC|nr:iron uptake porin [Aphanothece sp. CMT-3BRIN-NPC111]
MSKVLWKSLLISPAVLGATLVLSGNAIAAEKQVVSEAIQPQTAQATKIKEVTLAAVPESPANNAVQVSTSAAALQEQTVAVKASEPTLAKPAEASSQFKMPSVETQVAQASPAGGATEAAPVDTKNLQQILQYSNEGQEGAGQITNASQFRDVQPSDWAYEALDRVVQRYGCLVGYPDGTYRGNRALSRYEFAAGLNACLRQIESLIAANGADAVSRRDFEALQRLVEEFRTELATLGTRVDNLEGRTAFLEARQFSTTTKLAGEAIFAYTDSIGDERSPGILGDRVRLDLRTSFTGRDTLHTRLAAGNLDNPVNDFFQTDRGVFNGGTFEGNQTFNIKPGGIGSNNDIQLDWLSYYFPFGSSKVYLAATGGIHSDYAPTLNPYFEDYDGGNGALSTFAQESPIYRIGGGAGGAVTLGAGRFPILGPTSLTVGYLADNANVPFLNDTEGRTDGGLVNGDFAALGQLNFNLSDRVGVGLTYVRGRHSAGQGIFDLGGTAGQQADDEMRGRSLPVVGTALANDPSRIRGIGAGGGLLANRASEDMTTNSYGVEVAIRPSNSISLSGFAARTFVDFDSGRGDTWTFGAGLALPNFGKQGNLLGIFGGAEPTLRGLRNNNGSFVNLGNNRDYAYHIEGFYKYQLTDNISVTPGVIWLLNPNQTDSNDDAVIGTLRTTFTF